MQDIAFVVTLVVLIIVVVVILEVKAYYFRSMDEIVPNMYLGNLKDANNRQLLKHNGITHVLSIVDLPVKRYPDLCVYK